MTGSSRTRTPVAWWTAAVMAAANPARPISPMPRSSKSVDHFAGDTERYLDEAPGITAPSPMHLAEEDEFIDKDAQAQIKGALASVPSATIYSYPGQNHAFARHNGLHYNAEAAALATSRTFVFLAEHSRPGSLMMMQPS